MLLLGRVKARDHGLLILLGSFRARGSSIDVLGLGKALHFKGVGMLMLRLRAASLHKGKLRVLQVGQFCAKVALFVWQSILWVATEGAGRASDSVLPHGV